MNHPHSERMRYGLSAINLGRLGEPATFQEIARTAEDAGWDGLFVWDNVSATWSEGVAISDPWMLLAGAACVTERIAIGTNVTPVPRRRPQVLAAQVATLDHLSNGRAVLGVGLGGDEADFVRFGEDFDAKVRAEKLDESLEIITGLWSGEVVRHRGRHYVVDGIRNLLGPVQRPRCPIWVGGDSRPALRRAARWDGWTTSIIADESGKVGTSPSEMAERVQYVLEHRDPGRQDDRFDIVVDGYSDAGPAGAELADSYAAAGATWWLDGINGLRGSAPELMERIAAGPPRA